MVFLVQLWGFNWCSYTNAFISNSYGHRHGNIQKRRQFSHRYVAKCWMDRWYLSDAIGNVVVKKLVLFCYSNFFAICFIFDKQQIHD
uniref:Putative secreted protein n=1 Tax=Xenopsylla cheopis TaxID=163159 RepID=A0A6M2E063_XENCH